VLIIFIIAMHSAKVDFATIMPLVAPNHNTQLRPQKTQLPKPGKLASTARDLVSMPMHYLDVCSA
jgi:hypothetical protein